MSVLETILWPIVAPMGWVLNALHGATGSMGLAIILLAIIVSLLLSPLRRRAGRIEQRITTRLDAVNAEVRNIVPSLKGEERFNAMEAIYQRHDYHPLQTLGMSASLMVMLPVFLTAIVLIDADTVGGYGFAFIRDLGAQDELLPFAVNFLPFLMTGLSLLDARIRFAGNTTAMRRFIVITTVLLVLVYPLASGLIIYWTTSNLVALAMLLVQSPRKL